MKRIVRVVISLFLFLFVILGVYIIIAWIPVKYAVREEDFIKYGKFVLLQGNYDTGTGSYCGKEELGSNIFIFAA
jgi:hypothetical protein